MSHNNKSKKEHYISHKFHELDIDNFETERDYRQERKRLKKQMSKTRRAEHKRELKEEF